MLFVNEFFESQDVRFEWSILEYVQVNDLMLILFNPSSYMLEPGYKQSVRNGMSCFKNFVAYNRSASKIWEADFPTEIDYYHKILSENPLILDSFSCYQCEVDPSNGKIISKHFHK